MVRCDAKALVSDQAVDPFASNRQARGLVTSSVNLRPTVQFGRIKTRAALVCLVLAEHYIYGGCPMCLCGRRGVHLNGLRRDGSLARCAGPGKEAKRLAEMSGMEYCSRPRGVCRLTAPKFVGRFVETVDKSPPRGCLTPCAALKTTRK